MGAKYGSYSKDGFYGTSGGRAVPGLTKEIRHGVRASIPYAYIVLRDTEGIKWRIVPRIVGKGGVLNLYHRSKFGRSAFHSQSERQSFTPGGLAALLDYIEQHEQYERGSVVGVR